jgi:hypothetical protein
VMRDGYWQATRPALRIPAPAPRTPPPYGGPPPCRRCDGQGIVETTSGGYVEKATEYIPKEGYPDLVIHSERYIEPQTWRGPCGECRGNGTIPAQRAIWEVNEEYARRYDEIASGVAERNHALTWRGDQLERWLANS